MLITQVDLESQSEEQWGCAVVVVGRLSENRVVQLIAYSEEQWGCAVVVVGRLSENRVVQLIAYTQRRKNE